MSLKQEQKEAEARLLELWLRRRALAIVQGKNRMCAEGRFDPLSYTSWSSLTPRQKYEASLKKLVLKHAAFDPADFDSEGNVIL